MQGNDTEKIDDIVEQIYEDFDIKFPLGDTRELPEKLGGEFVVSSRYKVGDEAAVIKYRTGFAIVICNLSSQYTIDPVTKANTDYLICRTIGQLMLHMGYHLEPKKWERISNGVHPYKEVRYAKQKKQLDYFANALMLPKTIYENASIHHTQVGYSHGINVREMALDLHTTPLMIMERGKQLGYYLLDKSIY